MSKHPFHSAIAVHLKEQRVRKGVAVKQLARALRCHPKTISQFEDPDRSRTYRVQSLLDYAEALGMDVKIELVEKTNGA